ncbi:hypothetical protein J3Q64DRAFT_1705409 [Phycomyces blakesleeanus]|uniref:Uncharacterized protein n=2 Tax=Phycomyces blakesleeanus TaxID=4837 RepID=A0A162Y2E0_PHYB8|nr:hypothetical protein PHYBLDRAFT_79160 [Phycomyces blakesleeanus NRRL 1555(-)]OAD78005.1 hypothetical protein PHYBLDRAFT_79160 [Phycomyces blakesleeanus NRRL 1555(-)]|eukprot:XP_018296045.1 hypothetical protein PHYBLDRAFT_79160 [Phycomyces blakesleeanus NRRL 1555(-)]
MQIKGLVVLVATLIGCSLVPTLTALPITSKLPNPDRQPDDVYNVNVDQFAQLVSTHLQFDHLDSIVSATYKEIASQFQHHIEITTQSTDPSSLKPIRTIRLSSIENDQYAFQQPAASSGPDVMDLEILKAQMFGAIQAHTEGDLPVAWDRLADKLGRPALESFVRQLISSHCGTANINHPKRQSFSDLVVLSECLAQNSVLLSSRLDQYISDNLLDIFEALDSKVLPDMLSHTTRDLKDVLDYFNTAFLQDDDQELVLQVKPWVKGALNNSNQPTSLTDRLMALNVYPTNGEEDHPIVIFSHYASLAKV